MAVARSQAHAGPLGNLPHRDVDSRSREDLQRRFQKRSHLALRVRSPGARPLLGNCRHVYTSCGGFLHKSACEWNLVPFTIRNKVPPGPALQACSPAAGTGKPHGKRVWFITGTSRGSGRIWTKPAFERRDKVAATAYALSIADLAEKYGTNILTLALDVTKRAGESGRVAGSPALQQAGCRAQQCRVPPWSAPSTSSTPTRAPSAGCPPSWRWAPWPERRWRQGAKSPRCARCLRAPQFCPWLHACSVLAWVLVLRGVAGGYWRGRAYLHQCDQHHHAAFHAARHARPGSGHARRCGVGRHRGRHSDFGWVARPFRPAMVPWHCCHHRLSGDPGREPRQHKGRIRTYTTLEHLPSMHHAGANRRVLRVATHLDGQEAHLYFGLLFRRNPRFDCCLRLDSESLSTTYTLCHRPL